MGTLWADAIGESRAPRSGGCRGTFVLSADYAATISLCPLAETRSWMLARSRSWNRTARRISGRRSVPMAGPWLIASEGCWAGNDQPSAPVWARRPRGRHSAGGRDIRVVFGQSDPRPSFEVASIRPNAGNRSERFEHPIGEGYQPGGRSGR